MALPLFYPAVAILALFVLGVIMVILRYGAKWCKLRHHTLPDYHEWQTKGYDQQISYA